MGLSVRHNRMNLSYAEARKAEYEQLIILKFK